MENWGAVRGWTIVRLQRFGCNSRDMPTDGRYATMRSMHVTVGNRKWERSESMPANDTTTTTCQNACVSVTGCTVPVSNP